MHLMQRLIYTEPLIIYFFSIESYLWISKSSSRFFDDDDYDDDGFIFVGHSSG